MAWKKLYLGWYLELYLSDPILSTQTFGAAEIWILPTQRIGAAAIGILATQTFRGLIYEEKIDVYWKVFRAARAYFM